MTTENRTIEFHKAFGHPTRVTPQTLGRKEALLALGLIEEEFRELAEAMFPGITEDPHVYYSISDVLRLYSFDYNYDPNLVEIADAIGDLDVVVNGAGIRHGFDMEQLGKEIHRSNMSKLDADGKPVYKIPGDSTSKVGKSELFREPELAAVLGIEK